MTASIQDWGVNFGPYTFHVNPPTMGGERNRGNQNTSRIAVRDEWFYSIVTGTAAADIAVSGGVAAVLKRIRNVGSGATVGTLRVSDGASTSGPANGQTSYPPTTGGTFQNIPAALAAGADVYFDGLVCATSLVIQASNAADVWMVEWMPL